MQSSDLKVYSALANGRKSTTQVNTGVVQNVFPHVTSAQRASGVTDYAKTHWALANTDNYELLDPESYQDKPTLSPDDYVVMCLLGQRDPVSTLATTIAAAGKVGSGVLQANISASDTTLTVTVKHADLLPGGTDDIFLAGKKIKVCSHSDALATDGAEEIRTISGTPTYSGLIVTITVTEAFVNAFTADGTTRVSSLIKPGDTKPSATTPVITSTSGTFDTSTYPIILDNIGTPEEDWTLTFTDATHFTLTGDTVTNPGSGVVGTAFAPDNPDYSRPFFTIEASALGGTFVAGDTITFTTHPATVPIGQKRVVSAGAASLANNKVTQVYGGEAQG